MKLAPPTCAEVVSALRSLGFEKVKVNAGSHDKYRHENFRGRRRNVSVDCPKAPFDHFLVQSMAKQAGLTKKEFKKLCAGLIEADALLKSEATS